MRFNNLSPKDRKIPSQENLTIHTASTHTDAIGLITPRSQVISITQGHSTDLLILAEILRTTPDISFIGVIGSASKRATLTRELRETCIPQDLIEKIHCPPSAYPLATTPLPKSQSPSPPSCSQKSRSCPVSGQAVQAASRRKSSVLP
ncbi:MAG: XdhC family protein [Verrucomicrobia bacterium]|nr:XdhC family protein [Verrucomicrobiota bacterium]